MTKITTDFVGGETTAEDKARITAIAEWWLGSGALAAAATRGDVRTLLNTVCIPPITSGELCGSFYPKLNALNDPESYIAATLFGGGAAGFHLDFADLPSLYQDILAATPLTLPDQSVGLAADRSRARSPITVAAAAQASLGLRPKWGRMPKGGRRNLFTETEFRNGVSDAPTRGGLIAAVSGVNFGRFTSTGLSIGHDGVTHSYAYKSFSVVAAQYTFSVHVLMDTDGPPAFDNSVLASALNDFLLTVHSFAIDPTTYVVESLGGRAYRVSATLTDTAGTKNFGVLKYSTNSTRTFKVTGYQVELGSTATAYQAVTNAFDVTEAGLPSYGYIRPDLMDDFLTVTTPAAQTGDVMVFGRKGSWLESGVAYGSGAAVAIGPTTMTGLPAGLLQAVQGPVSDISGGLVGVLAIGRTLTEAERTAALNYYKARGAAGLLTAGAELREMGVVSTVGLPGTLATFNTSTGAGSAYRLDGSNVSGVQLPVTDGRTYLLDVEQLTGSLQIRGNGVAGNQLVTSVVGRQTYRLFVAAGEDLFFVTGANAASVTFIVHSVRELTVTP